METEDYTYYPPKPELKDKNSSSVVKTVLSLVAFIAIFILFGINVNLIFLIVLVLFLHEMGHLIAMKSYKYEDVGMMFIPMLGAVVTGRKDRMSQFQRVIIVLAGPIPGIFIGILIMTLATFYDSGPIIFLYGAVFIALNVFNLFPINPLDGGKLFELLFFSFNDISKLVFQAISALTMIGVGYYVKSYIFVGLGALLLFRLQSVYKMIQLRKRLSLLDIPLESTYENLSDKHFWMLRKEYIHHSNLSEMMQADSKEYDSRDSVLAGAIRNLLKTPIAKDIKGGGKFGFVLLWIISIALSVWMIIANLNQIIEALYLFQE